MNFEDHKAKIEEEIKFFERIACDYPNSTEYPKIIFRLQQQLANHVNTIGRKTP